MFLWCPERSTSGTHTLVNLRASVLRVLKARLSWKDSISAETSLFKTPGTRPEIQSIMTMAEAHPGQDIIAHGKIIGHDEL